MGGASWNYKQKMSAVSTTQGASVVHETLGLILDNETTLDLKVIDSKTGDKTCTYAPKKSRFVEQEFFRCPQCFRDGQGLGVCAPCARRCHRGHRGLVSIDATGAYCDCGLKTCSIACAIGPKCSYDEVGTKTTDWFECWTCWGGESDFGVCSECAKDCHAGHELVSRGRSNFTCDCGLNKHKRNVCTFHAAGGKRFRKQPFYYCASCFSNPASQGVCHQCAKNCHDGHRLRPKGTRSAYCDCGLPGCAIKCSIATPKP